MSDLFPVEEVLSPKLAWLKKHDLITREDKLPHAFVGGADRPWICCNRSFTMKGFGFDEQEAILDYCENFNVKHWTVESL